jgi:hypothetical protein
LKNNTIKNEELGTEFLIELKEYTQYLYEEELQRAERFHNASKTYLIYIMFSFSSTIAIIKALKVSPLQLLSRPMNKLSLIFLILISLALLFLVASLIFISLVIKVWQTEKLCDPEKFALSSGKHGDKNQLIEEIIANFVIATKKYITVNINKGRYLSTASFFFRLGFILLCISGLNYLFL